MLGVKKIDTKRMQAAEMRMIRMMCGKTLLDRVPNAVLRTKTEVEDIEKHLAEHRLRWLGHIERMDEMNVIRRVWDEKVFDNIKRGRPKKTWGKVVKKDMSRMFLMGLASELLAHQSKIWISFYPQTRTDCDNFTLRLRRALKTFTRLSPYSATFVSKGQTESRLVTKDHLPLLKSPPMTNSGPIQMFLLIFRVEERLGQRNPALVFKRMEFMESGGLGNLGTD